ncbi:superoxide dismutase family protein [Qipengyuania sp. NPDC077563]|uniref:superoxide dismutase family protein n=1 Tax=Qipengyuania sp. NPDC077563 TaxID=3364497 RepID=UPI00384D5314
MRMMLAAPLAAMALAGCSTMDNFSASPLAEAQLTRANGVPVGTAQLVSDGSTLSLAMVATGLEPGAHGFHLHTTGRCEGPDFKSAGGHLNPLNREHGSLNPEGKHVGDMPNLEVGTSRTASTTIDIGPDTAAYRNYLFDADGTAIVIHAGPDDYRTDPAGDAGSRVACGVLTMS